PSFTLTDPSPPEVSSLSLHDALPICEALARFIALEPTLRSEAQEVIAAGDLALYAGRWTLRGMDPNGHPVVMSGESSDILRQQRDRKSTRLNSSHVSISYAVFCLKKK